MKAMSGVDGAFLHLETAETPMHVASLSLFDLPPRYRRDFAAAMRRQIGRRLRLVPAFTRRLAPLPLQLANPVWVDGDDVDLDHHVQSLELPAPGTQAQLQACVAGLHAQRLDRHHPLWRVVIITGLQTGQVGCFIQVHHAVLDGQAGVLLAMALFDLQPEGTKLPRGKALPPEHPDLAQLAALALRHDAAQYVKLLRHLPGVVSSLAGLLGLSPSRGSKALGFGPRTVLNGPITAGRTFAAVSLPLAPLKALAAARQVKLNDVVLALCAGLLRRHLARHGGVPRQSLVAAMPISLREAGNTEFGTQVTMSLVKLHTNIADPLKRLRAIRDSAGAVKAMAQKARGVLPTDFPSIGEPWLLQGLAALYGRSGLAANVPPLANVVISNVPGPQVPLYAAGARMATYWPLSIVEHGVGLNITVMSYAGALGFGFTAASAAVPDASALVTALHATLDELVAKSAAAHPGEAPCASESRKRSRTTNTASA